MNFFIYIFSCLYISIPLINVLFFQHFLFQLLSREAVVQMPQVIDVVYGLWSLTPSYKLHLHIDQASRMISFQDAQIPIVRLMPPYTSSTWDARFQDAWTTIQFQLDVFNSLSSIFMIKLHLAWVFLYQLWIEVNLGLKSTFD